MFKLLRYFLPLVFIFITGEIYAQNCTINAGIDQTICPGTPFVLRGTSSSSGNLTLQSVPVWTQIAGPAVTVSPTTNSGSNATATVSNFTTNVQYTFRLTAKCQDGSTVFQDVKYIVSDVSTATAGSDQTVCPGTFTFQGSALKTGETGRWTRISGSTNMPLPANTATPNPSITIPTSASVISATYRWTVTKGECSTFADVTLRNLGAQPISAGPDRLDLACYNVSTSTTLGGSFAANDPTSGQKGTWTFVSGPTVPVISSPNAHNSSVSNLREGTYTLRWTVQGPCINGSDEMQITVKPATQNITQAGGRNDIYCDGRTSVVLTAPRPSYTGETGTWTKISGAGTQVIQNPTSNVTVVTGLVPTEGTNYQFRYTINNPNTDCTSIGTYNVSFSAPPTLNITTASPYFAPCGDVAAAISYNFAGATNISYALMSAPVGSALQTQLGGLGVYSNAPSSGSSLTGLNRIGTYVFRYRASTNNTTGGCDDVYKEISVVISNNATTSNAGTRQVLACNVVTTSLAGNTPATGIGTWSQVKGPNTATFNNINSPTAVISDLVSGVYTFRWIISGGDGGCTNTQQDVDVVVSAVVPVTAAAGNAKQTCYGTPVALDGSATLDNETGTWTVRKQGNIASEVTFSNINDPKATANGLLANTAYVFRWTVANSCNSNFSEVTITTTATMGPKQATAGPDQCLASNISSFTLAGNQPAAGETGSWIKVSGPASGNITNSTLYNTTVTGAANGTYVFEWRLSNGPCTETTDQVQITISAAPTTANAGPDQNICGNTVSLAGNQPTVGQGIWTQTEGAGGVTITDPTLRNTTVSGLKQGRYKFIWTITNGACVPTTNFDEVVINVSTPPEAADAGPDQTLCNQNSTTLAANVITTGMGRWAAVSGPTIPTFANISNPATVVSGLTYGTYVLEWISSGGLYCAPSTDRMTITVTQNANAGNNQTLCDVTSIALNGNANSTGTWAQVSGPIGSTITPTEKNGAIVTGLTTGIYVFSYTIDAIGSCPATSANVTYNISAPPTIANAGADQNICETTGVIAPIQLNGNTPTEGNGVWTVLEGPSGYSHTFSNSTQGNTTFTPTIQGTYFLQWRITNGNCSGASASSDLVRIIVSFPPTPSNAGANQTNQCSGSVNLAGNNPTSGLGTWTQLSGPNTATISQPNSPATAVLNTIPGTYVFTWTIRNGSVCSPSASNVQVIVTSSPPKLANAGSDFSACTTSVGGTGTATLVGNQPSGTETGLWTVFAQPSGAAPTFTNASLYNTTINGLRQGTYTLRWTLNNGSCSSFDDVVITVGDPPSQATITSGNQSVCLYQAVNLMASAVTSGTGTWSTLSKPANTGNPIFDNVNGTSTGVFGLEVGTYTFTFTTRTTATCSPSVATAVEVVVSAPPTPAISGSDKITCFNTPIALTGNTPTSGTGIWTVTSGQAATDYEFSAPTSPTSTFTGKVAGVFTVTWTISTGSGSCSSASSSRVTVQPELLGNQITTTNATLCSGSRPATIAISAPTGGAGAGSYAYQWQTSTNGTTYTNVATTAAYQPPTLTNTGNTTIVNYYRRLVTSGNCAVSTSNVVTFTVDPALGNNTVTAANTNICFSGATGIITGSAVSGGTGTYTYQWELSTDGGTTFNSILNATEVNYDPGVLTNAGNTILTYRYRRIVTSGASCTNTSNVATITINPRPTLTSSNTATTCSNNLFTYTPISLVTGTTFTWTRAVAAGINNTTAGGVGVINETLINTTTAPVNVVYVYTLTANGCQNPTTYSVTVTVNPSPRGLNESLTIADCTGNFTYNLQTNINKTTSIPSNFTWAIVPNANVSGIGTGTGSGTIINGALFNNTSVPQQVIYTITPTATSVGSCTGQPFTLTVNVPVCPGMTITKTTTRTTPVTAAGNTIPYTIVVTNTGNASQNNVVVRDPFLSTSPLVVSSRIGNNDNVLERGESWTYTGTYVVTQADIDNNGKPQINSGQLVNTASVTSTELPATQTSSTTVNILATSSYSVAKNSSVTAITTAGQVVPYDIVVTNTGNTAISNIVVSDPMLTNIILFSGDTNANQKLDQGEVWTYRGSHTVLQADLDANKNSLATTAGTIRNVVSVTGKKPNGDPVYLTPITAEKIIAINAVGSIGVIKNSIIPSVVKAGQVIPYTITIANTGKVAVSNISIADPLIPMAALSLYSGDIAPANGKLDVNETWTYRGDYTVTQADIDNNGNGSPVLRNGFLRNTATVTGLYSNGNVASANSNVFDIPINTFSAYSIQKTANRTQITVAGQVVTYTISVKNTGDAALSNIVVTDPMFTVLGARQGDLNNNNRLDLNETWTYTQNYTVTQAILDANGNNVASHPGMLSNTASVRATNTAGAVMPAQTSTLLIPLNTTSSFTITKTANQTQITAAGQVVTYTLTVKNTGTNAVRSVGVTDPMLSSISGPTGDAAPTSILDLNETWTYTGSYTVKQSDLDNNGNITPNGQLSNTVNVTANKPDGSSAGSASAVLNIPLNPSASFSIAKSSNGVTSVNKAGDLIPYTATIRNTGAVAVQSLIISDPMVNLVYTNGDANANGKLDLTEVWIYSGTYSVTQADIDNNGNGTAGKLINEVSATARTINGTLLPAVKATNTVDILATAAYAISKASPMVNITKAGQAVPYIITVTNKGTVAIENVRVTDPLLSATPLVLTTGDANLDGKLDVNETWNYIGTYTVTQSMIDSRGNGITLDRLVNTATINGNSPNGAMSPLNSNTVSIPIIPVNAFAVAKTSATINITAPGQVVPYTITVINTGDAALSNIVVNDSMLANGALTLTTGDTNNNSKLDVGETWNYVYNYTVTQADIDQNGNTALKGVLSNTATVSANTAGGTALTNLTATKIIPLSSSSSFTVDKSSDRASITKAGDVVNYTITVTNTGNTSINNVAVIDPLLGNSTNTVNGGDLNANNILDVAEVWTYKGSYTVTQADIDNNGNSLAGSNISSLGNLINIATVTGNKPDGSTAGTVSATNLVPIQPVASFVLTKTSDVTQVSKLGDQVVYTVTAKNTGAVAINTLIINDPMLNLGYLSGDLNGNGKLDVNETWTYRGAYTVKQSDIDNNGNGITLGKLVNRVTANGRKPDGSSIPEVDANHSLDVNFVATMNVQKTTSTKQITKAGQVVDYTITVANTGNVAIADVVLNDPLLPSTTLYSGDVNGNDILDVRETWTYNGSYTVTQGDIDVHGKPIANSGNLINTASVAGKLPSGTAINGTSNTVTIPIEANIAYSLTKESATTAILNAGQQVPYTITVKNIGDAGISDIVLNDPMVNLTLSSGDVNTNAKLDVNETWIYNGVYTVTQSDIDNNGNTTLRGVLSNTVTLSGKKPNGTALPSITASKVIPLNTTSLFTVTKTADRPSVQKAGDIINYAITINNTGVTAISNLKVDDPLLGGIIVVPSQGDVNSNNKLDVGETWTYRGAYTVTQADMDRNGNLLAGQSTANGRIINVVNVSGEKPDATTAGSITSVNEVPIAPIATFSLTKTADVTRVSKLGDKITYTVVAKNTGTVAISTFTVTDPMMPLGTPVGDVNNNAKLDVNETWTYKGVYTVSQSDIDNNGNGIIAGKLVNTVNAGGRRPDGTALTPVVTIANVDVQPVSTVRLTKASATTAINVAGQQVPYTITLVNTGTVAVSDVAVADPMLANLTFSNGDVNANNKLDVNETWTYVGSYTVTQGDIDNQGNTSAKGSLINTATANGKNPNGTAIATISSTKTIPVQQTISLNFTKVVTGQVGYIAGQTVTYEIKVTNSGNTTMRNIVVSDANATITSGSPIAQLNPGQVATITAVHTLTQPDVDAGKVINQATLTAVDANGVNVNQRSDDPSTAAVQDATVTQIVSPGSISLVKTALLSGDGNTITYNFTVKNSGIVTLSDVVISDTKIRNAITVNPSVLPPGATGTATATYTITAIEKAAEQVTNTAIVTATSPNGFKVNDVSGTTENNNEPTLVILPKITGAKSVADANGNGIIEEGEVLTYTITISNNGNVNRTGVSASDQLPANMTYVNGSASNGGVLTAGVVEWSNLTIPANGSLAVNFKATVNNNLPLGLTRITNMASISNPAEPATPVLVETSMPTAGKLESTKTVNDAKGNKDAIAQANETLTYHIVLKNSGGSVLRGIRVSDMLPTGLTYLTGTASNGGVYTQTGNVLNWTLDLAPGVSADLVFDAKVVDDVNAIPSLRNVANIVSPTGQTLTPEIIMATDPSADLVITKELIATAPVRTGDRIAYKITVANAGQNKATGVSVSDILPGSLDAPYDIVVTKGTSAFVANSKTLTWTIGDLALNELVTATFKTRVVATGSLVNTATVKADQPDPIANSNTASSAGSPIGGNDLFIPNLFTPNGDGNNDRFEIRGLDQFPDNELVIVNRWGNEVFRAKNYQNNWTGEGLNEGTYYYLLKAKNNADTEYRVLKGWVTLIRAFKK
ncbi:DUF7507 domain-containing protein [Pedobacter namyangjuensis]|uniref:DUF7507 domain-containing protein n=1 Tax=Pedobacter namyangjuensis TaxID=600626 RepID=UPI000DE27324|nr:gliding motility-associated C-terminal domain-containing protein [Pedobacter namyangjuensis]